MTALVTANLSLLSSAPNGIKKLRQLILTLAVKGRLVPQDQSEQPAAEFLNRIAAHKADAVARSRSRRPVEGPEPMEIAAAPYAPPGWLWTTFGNATICRDGERIPVSQADREQRKKLYDYYGASGVIDKIDGYLFDKPLLLIGEDGANLVNRSSPIAFIARGQYWVNNHAHVIDAVTEGLLKYLELYINAIDLKPYVTGTAQPKMNQAKLNAIPLALPPEAEQRRIVAKVDELMALCDRLEAEQADAEAAHAELVETLLASLTQARDAADFRASWQQLAEHFHTLFTTEASVDALKQIVLQLAVTGRLLPLDAPFPDDTGESIGAIPLPRHWDVVPFNDLVDQDFPIAYGVLVPGPEDADGVPFVRIADLSLNAPPPLPEKRISREVDAKFSRTRLVGGEILMGVVGSIGKLGLAPPSWAGANIARAICRIVPAPTVSREFVVWLLQSDLMRSQFIGDTRTLAQPTLNVGLIRAARTPLPPLEEQQQIVVMIDRLMALCDELQRSLVSAGEHHENLASVLVEQAIA